MKQKNIPLLISLNILLSVLFSSSLYSCSSQINDSPGKISSASSLTIMPQLNNVTEHPVELVKIYSQAISDYIRLVKKEYKLTFDTLFFGRHVVGQRDDFPNIKLPASIENTNIQVISPEQGKKKQKESKSSFYVNMIGWVNSDKAEFILVTFSNGMAHQFDCFLNYRYNFKKKSFDLENSRFEKQK